MTDPVLFWFRDDLRLADNPALLAACADHRPLRLIYIYEEGRNHARPLGSAQRWWLHRSLERLSQDIAQLGGELELYVGDPSDILPEVVKASNITAVYWNRRYHKASIACDSALKATLEIVGVPVRSFNGRLLREPWEVKSKTGGPMKVFTPFWRAAREGYEVPHPLPGPSKVSTGSRSGVGPKPVSLDELHLCPTSPDWSQGLAEAWVPGEAGALDTLDRFLDGGFEGYSENRNRPDLPSTSRLAPYLRFGEISIRQVWHSSETAVHSGRSRASAEDLRVFQSELGWREFSYHLLYHQEDLATINVQRSFDRFTWVNDPVLLKAWQRGQTGYPIVDAGMRELWQTGFMHNRVRMIVASFLIKHLRIDWRKGEDWFWDTLLDADPASNPASWQWIAGSGADAAPYFRIFNPMLQSEKFDPKGTYIRRFVPELAGLSPSMIHAPWEARPLELSSAGVKLGSTYPFPVVDHERARDSALKAFQALKESA